MAGSATAARRLTSNVPVPEAVKSLKKPSSASLERTTSVGRIDGAEGERETMLVGVAEIDKVGAEAHLGRILADVFEPFRDASEELDLPDNTASEKLTVKKSFLPFTGVSRMI